MLGELAGRSLDEAAHQAAGEADPVALHVGAGILPHGKGFGVVTEVDADLLQHGVGIVLDQFQLVVGEGLVELDLARM